MGDAARADQMDGPEEVVKLLSGLQDEIKLSLKIIFLGGNIK